MAITTHAPFTCFRLEITHKDLTAHLKYVKRIANLLGGTIINNCTPNELIFIIGNMDPTNVPGSLTIIVHMGAGKLYKKFQASSALCGGRASWFSE